jgi:hypothetical protein
LENSTAPDKENGVIKLSRIPGKNIFLKQKTG